MGSGRTGGFFNRLTGIGGPVPLEEAGSRRRSEPQQSQPQQEELRATLTSAAGIFGRAGGIVVAAAQLLPQQTPGEIGLTAIGAASLIMSEAARLAARRIARRYFHTSYADKWRKNFWDCFAAEIGKEMIAAA